MIKVAIIGSGAIAPSHIQAYLQFTERCEVIAICDIYPEKARKTAEKFQLESEIYDNYIEMLKSTDIDLVSICTPPYTHADMAIDCLNAGKHVLVEKPMASSLEECDRMIEAVEKNKKILSVVAQNRFRTPMMKLKKVLDSQLTGQIVHTQVDSFWWRGHSYYDLWWRGTWEKEGGGCTLNHAVHHIDIFQWMNGMPNEVTAVMSNTSHDNAEVEDISIAICKYNNGSLAQITSSVIHHGEEQQLIFQGKNARVSVPWKVKASQSQENGFPLDDLHLEKKITELYSSLPEVEYEGHPGQIDDVLTAIEENDEVLISGKEGRQTLELITAIYQSASLGGTVKLPLDKSCPFYTRESVMKNAIHFYEKKTSVENFTDNKISTGGNY
ncbi:Gfo/Idh/MocA family protein [Lederbergia wuyishanensis]|uniref:Dehydrogenase n=1 Tax=Lederbergia wuyishanensis TaxID=1347903 RepID=A0ABU0CZ84_9BACI|nr:Gfo/Idh/MocA family oxidoreductase [Lederbergia wuyishanensis]MCJ8006076.1 Gfo/Idh/MocA family oxidoreductase [Lederbergia wuyishanensis]MDQ0341445.1 putative dehydrogenase [Lederbergia wuyishanensis]